MKVGRLVVDNALLMAALKMPPDTKILEVHQSLDDRYSESFTVIVEHPTFCDLPRYYDVPIVVLEVKSDEPQGVFRAP